MKTTTFLHLASTVLISLLPAFALGSPEVQTFHTLTTGNGHGFTLFASDKNRLIGMLDHPYRYLRAPADIRTDGPERRNLLEDLQLGFELGGKETRLDDWASKETSYDEQTNIIYNKSELSGLTTERYTFSPFGLEKNAFIALAHLTPENASVSKATNFFSRLEFNLGANPVSSAFWDATLKVVKIPGETLNQAANGTPAWIERGHGLGAMIYIPITRGNGRMDCEVNESDDPRYKAGDRIDITTRTHSCQMKDLGALMHEPIVNGWWGVMVAYVEDEKTADAEAAQLTKWVADRTPERLLNDQLENWRKWRVPPPAAMTDADQIKLWRQSEAVLRMGQVREENQPGRTNHGMVLASLAPGHWATTWVRDGAYATVALARAGHFEEARESLDFFLNAQPVGRFKNYLDNIDYRISVTRYFGSGEEEADYSNQATPNVETDGWGLVLWAARQYVELSGDTAWLTSPTRDGTVYEALSKGVAQPIQSQLEPTSRIMKPDSSIWEVHAQNARHFAYTSITAARGLCDFAAIAKRKGDATKAATYARFADEVRTAIPKHFGSQTGFLVGAVERTPEFDEDGSIVEAFGLDVLKSFDDPLAVQTIDHMNSDLRVASGGFRRLGGPASYDAFEWPFIDFRMANAFLRAHKRNEAQELLDLVIHRASINFYLVPEMYVSRPQDGPLGGYSGSIPMVGYGAGAYILSTLERVGSFEARDCGTVSAR